MTAPVALRAGDRVLVTRLNYLGDVVLSLPLVDALRRAVPGVEIDYLTRAPGASLLAGDPRLSRVFEMRNGARAGIALVAALRARRYRAVIDLYSNPRSAWLAWLSGAPVRIGGDRRGRRRLYTHRVHGGGARAVSDIFLSYGAPLGVTGPARRPVLTFTDAERGAARERIVRAGATPGRVNVGVHPGGKWSVKRWPAEKFAGLVAALRTRADARVVLLTGPGEEEATERVAALAGDAAGVLPAMGVREAAAVIAGLDAMVACDGGIMHVAVAAGTPTVGIFGSAEPDAWFPYETFGPFRSAFIPLECRPCHRHVCPLGHTRCLNDLSVDMVTARLTEVLALARGRP